jgi:hypothetical protein
MEPNRLVTFYDLLQQGYTVAQLATAVEQYGVTGWDRFGRFADHAPPSKGEGARQALDVLAAFARYERTFEARVVAESANEDAIDCSSAIDDFDGWADAPLHHFGWPEDGLPALHYIPPQPQPTRPAKAPDPFRTTTALHIIGALLEFIESRHESYTQSYVMDTLIARHPGLSGITDSNLDKRFAQANVALGRTPKHSKRK